MSTDEATLALRESPAAALLSEMLSLRPTDIANLLRALRAREPLTEHFPLAVSGAWRDTIRYAGRPSEPGPWTENLVVNAFATLLTALCLTGRTPAYAGITTMALGQGSSSWDSGGTPAPAVTDTILVSEIARKALAEVQDIDGGNNVVTTGPTGRLLLTAVFNPSEAIGAIREFGLFGGVAAAGHTLLDPNQGIMVDHITHAVVNKTLQSDFTLTRQVSLSF